MQIYRCYFLDDHERINADESIEGGGTDRCDRSGARDAMRQTTSSSGRGLAGRSPSLPIDHRTRQQLARAKCRPRKSKLPMSKKKDRAWYVCPQLADLLPRHYESDAAAARALKTEPKVIAKVRSGAPVARSSLRKVLTRFASQHPLGASTDGLIVDIRTR
jgi:hypothetical protein